MTTAAAEPLWTEDSETTDTLAQAYFRFMSEEDLENLGHDEQRRLVERHLQAARTVDGSAVQVDSGPQSAVFVVHPDMRYLVDSVTAELTHLGHSVDVLNHPVFIVHRSVDDGSLKAVFDLPASRAPLESGETAELVSTAALTAPDGLRPSVESWISLRPVAPLSEDAATEATESITKTLGQVRTVVADSDRMRTIALHAATQLRDTAPSSAERVEETAKLLEWMAQGGFIFLGSRQYALGTDDDSHTVLIPDADSGAGLLQKTPSLAPRPLSAAGQAQIAKPIPLIATKTNSRSHIQRTSYMDYVAVKTYNDAGEVSGEQRFVGLWASRFYLDPVADIPFIRVTARDLLARSGFTPGSHSYQRLQELLHTYNREDLLQISVEELWEILDEVLLLGQRRRTKLFLRTDSFGRFVTASIYLPRDRYNTSVRTRLQDLLMERLGGESLDFGVELSESSNARLTFRIKLLPSAHRDGRELESLDTAQLQKDVTAAVRSWKESVDREAVVTLGEDTGLKAARTWDEAFPAAYRVRYDVDDALADISIFESLDTEPRVQFAPDTSTEVDTPERRGRLKVYSAEAITLSRLLPVLTNLGLEVLDELPATVTPADGRSFYLYDLGVEAPEGIDLTEAGELIEESVAQTLIGANASDTFNRLTTRHGMSLLNVAILRSYAMYLRQLAVPFSLELMASTLSNYPDSTTALVDLFRILFDPNAPEADTEAEKDTLEASQQRREAAEKAHARVLETLDAVSSADADRVLRGFLSVIHATRRTSAYVRDRSEAHRRLSFKLAPSTISFAPQPRPKHELWVHSPEVSGTHLRYDDVARGGLRWSDRSDDFRTEVLGLVQTQQVKNSVIVPAGAKGCFYPHQLPDPAMDRGAWVEAGRDAYKQFISGLLDITDNQRTEDDGSTTVWTPQNVIRHDGYDPYLVVAADKGTAAFSDTANEISQAYGFWLGDAFASGGSVGYDHKAMGITARGAWESVRSHFSALGMDADTDPIRVVGIGDMSGDVFGNGMRRSKHMKLTAAFNHLHIFVDPDPVPEQSFEERERLYHTPRSTWADYSPELISEGGGVFERHAKSIDLTPQIREALGIDEGTESLSGDELVTAILTAPVDLVYNGGIGTYIKSSQETHDDVGDRANDAIRVNGADLRTRVVVEGGNLGATQAGRIEAAQHGVHINTDAIDNSAGVDASDHEVNIKILVNAMVDQGALAEDDRADLLHSMTDQVAELVLATNIAQNRLLRVEENLSELWMPSYSRFITWLEDNAGLDRQLENIPDTSTMQERISDGLPLYTPELAVLAAYAKISLVDQLTGTDAVSDEWFSSLLVEYFPETLQDHAADLIPNHPLAQDILITQAANHVINSGGITAVHRAQEETGADISTLVRAFFIAEEIYDIPSLASQIADLPASDIDPQLRLDLMQDLRRLVDRLLRWLIHHQLTTTAVADRIDAFHQEVRQLVEVLPDLLVGEMAETYQARRTELLEAGVPESLATRLAGIFESYALLDIVEVARQTQVSPTDAARTFFSLQDSFDADYLLNAVTHLPRRTRWQALARASIREDLYNWSRDLTVAVLEQTQAEHSFDSTAEVEEAVDTWTAAHRRRVARVRSFLGEVREELGDPSTTEPDMAMMSVVISRLNTLIL